MFPLLFYIVLAFHSSLLPSRLCCASCCALADCLYAPPLSSFFSISMLARVGSCLDISVKGHCCGMLRLFPVPLRGRHLLNGVCCLFVFVLHVRVKGSVMFECANVTGTFSSIYLIIRGCRRSLLQNVSEMLARLFVLLRHAAVNLLPQGRTIGKRKLTTPRHYSECCVFVRRPDYSKVLSVQSWCMVQKAIHLSPLDMAVCTV